MVNLGGAEPLNFFSVATAGEIIRTLVFKRHEHSYSVFMESLVYSGKPSVFKIYRV